jgi:hypothetical protein
MLTGLVFLMSRTNKSRQNKYLSQAALTQVNFTFTNRRFIALQSGACHGYDQRDF